MSGCLGAEGEGPRLAQPTDKPIVVPATTSARPNPSFNTSDPGYVVTGVWRVGDGWDYASNQSHLRSVRVVDSRLVSGVMRYHVETRDSTVNASDDRVTRAWVSANGWVKLNETDEDGTLSTYEPGAPQRFWRNSSASYERARTSIDGTPLGTDDVILYARLFPLHQTIQYPWGYVEAKRVEQIERSRSDAEVVSQRATTLWVHRDYLGPVQFQLEGGETYKLTAVKAGDFRRGTLRS